MKNSILRGLFIVCLGSAFIISASSAPVEHFASQHSLDSLLNVFDDEILRADHYLSIRRQTIESMQRTPTTPQQQLAVADLYLPYQSDSAMLLLSKLIASEPEVATEARIKLLYLAASVGSYNTGLAYIIGPKLIPINDRARYYDALSRLYGGASEASKEPTLYHYYGQLAEQYKDSVRHILPEQTNYLPPFYNYYINQMVQRGEMDSALAMSDSVLVRLEEDSHDYAVFAYRRANLFLKMGDTISYQSWIVRSAISDIREGVTDNGSSWLVAQYAYEKGDLERAYHYIEYSLANAAIFNAPTRYLQTNPVGHIIGRAYQDQQRQQSKRLLSLVIALALMVLMFVLIVIYTLHQNHSLQMLNHKLANLNERLHQTNMQLEEANDVKEQYICQYLEVNSEYIHRMSKLARKAGDKDPEAFLNHEMDEFYKRFDNTFLSLYPNFVEEFNGLLRPEERITPKQGELLTTELRIFALIRLGIDSSSKIADLLCYSRNTIANYRVRVKNAAIGERTDFDKQVRTLSSHQH